MNLDLCCESLSTPTKSSAGVYRMSLSDTCLFFRAPYDSNDDYQAVSRLKIISGRAHECYDSRCTAVRRARASLPLEI